LNDNGVLIFKYSDLETEDVDQALSYAACLQGRNVSMQDLTPFFALIIDAIDALIVNLLANTSN
jgi:hypothetical protein